MTLVATTWLVAVLVGIGLWTVSDTRQFRMFKEVTDSAARQRFYALWTAQSFVLLVGASIVTAWVLGRSLPLLALPPEFQPLASILAAPEAEPRSDDRSSRASSC